MILVKGAFKMRMWRVVGRVCWCEELLIFEINNSFLFWLPSRLLLSWGQLIDDVGFTLWLCIRYSHWGIFRPFFRDSYLLLDDMTIFIHGYRDVWLILTDSLLCIRLSTLGHIPLSLMRSCIDGWSLLVVYLTTSTLDYPHWGIFPSPRWDCVWAVVRGWMIIVCCSPHDFDIRSYTGAYFPILFEYPWDWDNGQLSFRLSISLELSAIDYIRTSLHGFVEIEMDHIGFH